MLASLVTSPPAEADPGLVTSTPTLSVTHQATSTPTVAPTRTPTPTNTPLPTVTPTPTLGRVAHVTTENTIDMVMPWGYYVEQMETYDLETALILSVMAAESAGNPSLVSHAGACGLMQVIWKPWLGVSKGTLCSNSLKNIEIGIRILKGAIDIANERDEDLRYALAYYNCSLENVHADRCGTHGGLNYADKVLNFWLPRIRARIEGCVAQYGEDFWGIRNGFDLPGCSW